MSSAPVAMLLANPRIGLAARALLTLPFWWSGVAKLLGPAAALDEMRSFGLTPALPFALAVVAVQLGGSALLILGRNGWLGAGALGIFTALATLVAHRFWDIADPVARFYERALFIEHAGLIGGLVVAAILAERERFA